MVQNKTFGHGFLKYQISAKGDAVEGSHGNGVRVEIEVKKGAPRTGTGWTKGILGTFLPEFLLMREDL